MNTSTYFAIVLETLRGLGMTQRVSDDFFIRHLTAAHKALSARRGVVNGKSKRTNSAARGPLVQRLKAIADIRKVANG